MNPSSHKSPLRRTLSALALPALALVVLAGGARAQFGHSVPSMIDEQATMADRLGEAAVLNGTFRDETGREVQLDELLSSDKPLILNLGYFNCPGLCGLVLNRLLKVLEDTSMTPGVDFDLVTVSIADAEGPELAASKKANYSESLGNPDWTADWHLLTGPRESIDPLAESVGWRFRKDELTGEYDHPPTVVLISPSGVVTRYLDARYLDGSTLRRAVVESSDGQIGSFAERILVSCLTFDPSTGAYTMTAMTVMQLGGLVTVIALSFMIFVLWRRERRRHATPPEPAAA